MRRKITEKERMLMKEVNHLRKVVADLQGENEMLAFELAWAKGETEYQKSVVPYTLGDVLDWELEDDDTPHGGVAFMGETVRDFLEEAEGCGEEIRTIKELNEALIECGIRTIWGWE